MNREIKFRGWCNETSNMCNSNEYEGDLPTGLFMSIDECKKDSKTFEMMRYIGEEDLNGENIWMSDIVDICVFTVSPSNPDCDEHFRGVIEEIEGKISFVFKEYMHHKDGWRKMKITDPFGHIFEDWDDDLDWHVPLWDFMFCSGNLGEFQNDNIEVIGNIHENPDLLDSK